MPSLNEPELTTLDGPIIWIRIRGTYKGTEQARFRECQLAIFPYFLRRDQDDPRTSWRVYFPDGGIGIGVEKNADAARIGAEAWARASSCDHCHGRIADGVCQRGRSLDCEGAADA